MIGLFHQFKPKEGMVATGRRIRESKRLRTWP